jgi:predicted PurR-regulated permease PerM
VAVLSDVFRALRAYIGAQLRNALILGGLYCIGFALTGVPWWLLTGFACGVLQQVPYLGSVAALALAAMLRWFAGGGGTEVALVFGVWLAIQVLDGFFLSPRAAGKAGVNPLASIAITIAAGFLFGPLGVILAVPAVAVILVVWKASKGRANGPPARPETGRPAPRPPSTR